MRTIIVIPARYASERFPGKPLASIAGVPMIERVWRNMTQAVLADDVFVATDDERIASVVRNAGGTVVMTESSLPSGTDRVWQAVRSAAADIVVNVQGDEPLLTGNVVDELVAALQRSDSYDIATLAVRVPALATASPDAVTVATTSDGTALYFSRATIPEGSDEVLRHVGIYAFRKSALERFVSADPVPLERAERLEQLRALDLGLRILVVPVEVELQAVDREADVRRVEQVLAGSPKPVVRLVALDADGVLTSGAIAYLGEGQQLVTFDVKDGHGVQMLRRAGYKVAVISGRDSPALRLRCRELGIEIVRTSVTDKAEALLSVCRETEIDPHEVCYVGDDEPDLAAFELAGLAAAPADATPAVRARAGLRLESSGGRGAVRELAERLLAGDF